MSRDRRKSKPESDDARLPAGMKLLLVIVLLFFVVGGAGLVYATLVNQQETLRANATTTAQSGVTAIAHVATATAQVTATDVAKANATATASTLANANATATAVVIAGTNATATAVAAFQVQAIAIAVSPASISGMTCGTAVSVVYTATITVAPGGSGGTVQLTWSIGSSNSTASLTFAPGVSVKTVTFTDMGNLALNNSFPRDGSISSSSPNVVHSTSIRPAGTCV